MILMQAGPMRKPICPTLVHDESTGVLICVAGIALSLYVLYRALAYFNKP